MAYLMESILEDISAEVANINVPTVLPAGELDQVDSIEHTRPKSWLTFRTPSSRSPHLAHHAPLVHWFSRKHSPHAVALTDSSCETRVGETTGVEHVPAAKSRTSTSE